jgi:hypothetical protein
MNDREGAGPAPAVTGDEARESASIGNAASSKPHPDNPQAAPSSRDVLPAASDTLAKHAAVVRNFPMQSSGSEILHAACLLAERRSVGIVAPIHDAIMVEGPLSEVDELSEALDQLMGDAAAVVLRGYRLPTDCQIIRPGEHYRDDRGAAMWETVTRLVAKLEKETA